MKNPPSVNTGCLLLAEYVDEGEIPTSLDFHPGEVVRPQLVAEHLDVWMAKKQSNDQVLQTLLEVVRSEADGPSRARMVEALVRLEAVKAMRKVYGHKPEFPGDLCSRIVDLFSPEIRTHREELMHRDLNLRR